MTREDLVKHWEVIEAFKNGKEIEFRHVVTKCWIDATDPSFNECVEYRFKQEPKYVPFDFSDAEKLIGRFVKSINTQKYINTIVAVSEASILVGYQWCTYKYLLDEYVFLDGSKCGKLCQ
jgi:hypothetical protein